MDFKYIKNYEVIDSIPIGEIYKDTVSLARKFGIVEELKGGTKKAIVTELNRCLEWENVEKGKHKIVITKIHKKVLPKVISNKNHKNKWRSDFIEVILNQTYNIYPATRKQILSRIFSMSSYSEEYIEKLPINSTEKLTRLKKKGIKIERIDFAKECNEKIIAIFISTCKALHKKNIIKFSENHYYILSDDYKEKNEQKFNEVDILSKYLEVNNEQKPNKIYVADEDKEKEFDKYFDETLKELGIKKYKHIDYFIWDNKKFVKALSEREGENGYVKVWKAYDIEILSKNMRSFKNEMSWKNDAVTRIKMTLFNDMKNKINNNKYSFYVLEVMKKIFNEVPKEEIEKIKENS